MGVLKVVPRGRRIVTQGELADEMYVVIEGRARIERASGGRRTTLGEVRRGDVVGEMGLLRQRPRSADVIASDDTELLVVDERFFEVLRRRYPRIAATILFNLTRLLSDRLERADAGLATPAVPQPTVDVCNAP
jgi:CRP-like cAMP-binding protein